jgi:hypothetical protein
MTAAIRQQHARVADQLDRMIALAADPADLERRVPEVSDWSVGLQLEHVTHVCRGVLDTLGRILGGDAREASGPNFLGWVFLTLNWIPRGRGKVPEKMRPQGIDGGRLQANLDRERRRLAELDLDALAGAGGTLPHPIFGPLDARRWLRFLEVHNHHHWKIVRDVLHSSR